MSTLSKVLVVLVILASLGLTYMGVRTYGTLKNYGTNYQKHVEKIAQQEEQLVALRKQVADARFVMETDITQTGAGRVWYGKAQTVNTEQDPLTQTDAVKDVVVGVEGSLPKYDDAKAQTVYVYETFVDPTAPPEGSEPSDLRYLGQFKVTFSDPTEGVNTVTMQPVIPIRGDDATLVSNSANKEGVQWVMYENMPHDRWNAFAGLTPDEIKSYFANPDSPAVTEFLHHGEAATNQDAADKVSVSIRFTQDYADMQQADKDLLAQTLQTPDYSARPDIVEARNQFFTSVVVKDKYLRVRPETANVLAKPGIAEVDAPVNANGEKEPERMYTRDLRDYAQLLHDRRQALVAIADEVRRKKNSLDTLTESIARLEQDLAIREGQIAEAKAELEHLSNETKEVQAIAQNMQEKLETLLATTANLKAENSRMAEELRQAQLAEAAAIRNRRGAETRPVSVSK